MATDNTGADSADSGVPRTPDSREALQQLIQEMREKASLLYGRKYGNELSIGLAIEKWAQRLADVLGSPRPENLKWQPIAEAEPLKNGTPILGFWRGWWGVVRWYVDAWVDDDYERRELSHFQLLTRPDAVSAEVGSPRPEKVWQCHFCGRDGVGEPFLGSIVTNGIERHPFFCSWKCRYAWAKSLYTASAEVVSPQPTEADLPTIEFVLDRLLAIDIGQVWRKDGFTEIRDRLEPMLKSAAEVVSQPPQEKAHEQLQSLRDEFYAALIIMRNYYHAAISRDAVDEIVARGWAFIKQTDEVLASAEGSIPSTGETSGNTTKTPPTAEDIG